MVILWAYFYRHHSHGPFHNLSLYRCHDFSQNHGPFCPSSHLLVVENRVGNKFAEVVVVDGIWSMLFLSSSQIIASPHIWYHILECHVSRVTTMYLTIVFAITLGHHCQTPIMSKIHYNITVSSKVTQVSAYMTISVPQITCCPQQF